MSRVINRRIFIQNGISYYLIQDSADSSSLTHVLRIDVQAVQPFVLGSIVGENKKSYGGNIKALHKRRLSDIAKNAQRGIRNIRVYVDNKPKTLKPLWITNGTFFLDDCQNDWIQMAGSIIDSTVPVNYRGPLPKPKLLIDPPARSLGGPVPSQRLNFQEAHRYRGVFLQRLNNGIVSTEFRHSRASASEWASLGYYSAIGGAGILVENGNARATNYMYRKDKGFFPSVDTPTYCAGPIIATNETKNILYLILDRTHLSGGRYGNWGRPWGEMSDYLKNNFLGEIGRRGDGRINSALVYDGGGSRGLWIRKRRGLFGLMRGFNPDEAPAYGGRYIGNDMNTRLVPHHICLWA